MGIGKDVRESFHDIFEVIYGIEQKVEDDIMT
jgi:hypothetical protein